MEESIKEKCDLINFNSYYIFDFADRVELILEPDWEVKNEKGKTFVVHKQPLYPKSFENCLKILGYNIAHTIPMNHGHNGLLMMKFQRLLIYRDTYWKIAGEEMGLGKPWQPDYTNPDIDLYVIINIYNRLEKVKYGYGFQQCILTFPTEEMRDEFFENFKDLIESCKELL